MSGPLADFLPVASFLAGLSGSLHCLGMCGGLVTASCSRGNDVLKYQAGRLLGYLALGTFSFSIGYILKGVIPFSWGPYASGFLLGFTFIFLGVKSFSGRRVEIPVPRILGKAYQYLFRSLVRSAGAQRSFYIGLISILLPCGLVYGIILSALALGEFSSVMLSLGFFWLGTLPAMIGAPHVIRKILDPMKEKLPRMYACTFILIGVLTISGRLMNKPVENSAIDRSQDGKVHRCH